MTNDRSPEAEPTRGRRRSRRAVLVGASAAVAAGGALAARQAWRDREPPAPPVTDAQGRLLWSNWSGLEHAYPAVRLAPADEDELVARLKAAPSPIRPVGAGHSFTGLATTPGTLLSLDRLTGVVSGDAERLQATVRAGTRLFALGRALAEMGLELANLPDINKQSFAGAIATATHGTGRTLPALHGNVVGLRLATPAGELIDCDAQTRPELFHAARVGLGAFGVVTQVTLQAQPLKRIRQRTEARPTDAVLEDWPRLQRAHRNAEFFILPFTGHSILITHDETDAPVRPRATEDGDGVLALKGLRDWFEFAPPVRKAVAGRLLGAAPQEYVDEGWKLLSNERTVRFIEMEYHLPIEAHVTALREVLAAIETHRRDVFFPIEARVIAADDAWLSPFYGRESGSVAVHAYYKDDHKFLYELIEPILRRHGGRPHWGKLNSLAAPDFAALYPRWREAGEVRRAADPEGRLLNPYLHRVFLGDRA